jgi:hypothetical protein
VRSFIVYDDGIKDVRRHRIVGRIALKVWIERRIRRGQSDAQARSRLGTRQTRHLKTGRQKSCADRRFHKPAACQIHFQHGCSLRSSSSGAFSLTQAGEDVNCGNTSVRQSNRCGDLR